jgi:biotin synthase-like enzyme
MDLLYEAASIHREHHDPNVVQVSTLLSIKTGGCPEDCVIAHKPQDTTLQWKATI